MAPRPIHRTVKRIHRVMAIADPAAFIRENTRLQPVPHAPEISLWLADEVTPISRMTEE